MTDALKKQLEGLVGLLAELPPAERTRYAGMIERDLAGWTVALRSVIETAKAGETVKLTVELPLPLYKRLEAASRGSDTSVLTFVERAIGNQLAAPEKLPPED